MSDPEHAFAEYRRSGSPAAMARVFDALAPELVLLAAHLARPGVDAEDLVQATFLDAMRGAARWDSDRRLMPWLVGILMRNAQAEARRAARIPDPSRLQPRTEGHVGDDPARAGETEETAAEVARALAELPLGYRQVLVLRSVHGLTPTQIAHALACPVATVKTRLRRGTERLRALLPAGLAASLAVLVGSGRGLAAVRGAVLAEAGAAAGVTGAAATVGTLAGAGVAMKKAILIGVLAAGAAVSWLVWARADAPEAAAPGAVDAAAATLTAAPSSETPARATTGEVVRTAVAQPSSERAATGAATLTFTWQGDDTPAARLRVTCQADAGDVEQRGRTDADGRLHLEGLAPGVHRIVGLVGVRDPRFEVVAGETAEVTFSVPPSLRVRGVVLDAADRPVGGAAVYAQYFNDPTDDEPQRLAVSDAQGRFAFAFDRAVFVWARCRGHAASRTEYLAERSDPWQLTLHLGRAGCRVQGTVRTPSGAPAAGAWVAVVRAEAHGTATPLGERTDGEGRYALDELAAGEHHLVVLADGLAPAHRTFTLAPLGVEVVDVQLADGATLFGTVRDARGTPVRARFLLHPDWVTDHLPIRHRCTLRVLTREDGTFTLRHLPVGLVHLRVDAPGAQPYERDLDLLDGQELPFDVALAAGGEVRGRLVDAHGAPLAGWQVFANPHAGGLVAATRTDGDGRFLLAPLRDGPHLVTARPPDRGAISPPLAQRDGVRPGDADLELRALDMTRAGRLVGKVLDATGNGARLAKVLVTGRGAAQGIDVVTIVEGADGSFATEPLPPGEYRVRLDMAGVGFFDGGKHELRPEQRLDLGELRAPALGTLAVRLLHPDGRAVAAREVMMFDHHGNARRFTAGEDGVWRCAPAPAGRFVLHLRGGAVAPTKREVGLAGGTETELTLTLPAATVVRFVFAAEPPEGTSVLVRAADKTPIDHLLSPWRGALVPGSYTYEVSSGDVPAGKGSFEVSDDTTEVEVPVAFEPARGERR
ncbi:MAG: sigma-70 family RNA polymerase sigma factor [Planctomycetota bacterium]